MQSVAPVSALSCQTMPLALLPGDAWTSGHSELSWWSDDVTVHCGWLHLPLLTHMNWVKARARASSVMAFQHICDTAWWLNGAAS